MEKFYSFAPILPSQPQALILGSMPSVRSVAQEQYYAHPQNAFWPMLAQIYPEGLCPEQWRCGRHHLLPFPAKIKLLHRTRIALWDVLASCQRENSSDQSIRNANYNPTDQLLLEYPSITKIFLNGKKSASLFSRVFCKDFSNDTLRSNRLQITTLPSSSPADATLRFEAKLQIWCRALT